MCRFVSVSIPIRARVMASGVTDRITPCRRRRVVLLSLFRVALSLPLCRVAVSRRVVVVAGLRCIVVVA